MDKQIKTRIGILVYPETSASVILGMYDLFRSAGRDWGLVINGQPGPELLECLLVACDAGPVRVMNDVVIVPHTTLDDCPHLDIVCVPEVALPPHTPLAGRFGREIEWFSRRYQQGAVLAAVCSGAMLLAESGLLEGHDATTHWAWCDCMTQRFPGINVQPRRALVVSGEGQRLVMAGGGTSWMDLTLYLIARTLDVTAAMQVARMNLIDWHHVGQQPFATLSCNRQVEDSVIARCQQWIAEHYQEPNPVSAMTALSGLPARTFKRRFQQSTGMIPLEYVHAMRLEEAKQMLEATSLPVEAIANEVGYEDAGFFSRLFRRKVNLTPVQYRKRFGALLQMRMLDSGVAGLNGSSIQRDVMS